jgi:hypothetical protein
MMICRKSVTLVLGMALCLISQTLRADNGSPYSANQAAMAPNMGYYGNNPAYSGAAPMYPGGYQGTPYAGPYGASYAQTPGGDSSAGESMAAPQENERRWSASANALLLHRSTSGCQTLLVDSQTSAQKFNAANLESPYAGGAEFNIIRHQILEDFDLEFDYFSINSWGSSPYYFKGDGGGTPAGNVVLDSNESTRMSVQDVTFTEHCRIYNGEINLRTALCDRLTVFSGFRWMQLFEDYNASGVAYDGSSFEHSVRAANHLYGYQFGAQLDLFKGAGTQQFGQTTVITGSSGDRPFYVSTYIKTGVLSQNSVASIGSVGATDSSCSFLGETGLTGVYRLNEHIALRGGYRVMWIDQVAFAPRQIAVTDLSSEANTSVDTDGTLFCHGAHAGVEIQW